jgi:pimeloyl-ACP methyl ester carboxylesterase
MTMVAAPEIVLLPGLDGTGDLFDALAACLASDFTVKVVRYPNDASLGYAGYVELARNAVGTREVFLLGESFSGPIAVLVATQLGRQIKGLMLAATFLKNPWPGWLIRRASRTDPETTPKKIRDAILMGSYGDDELRKKVDRIVRDLSRPVREARLRAIAEVDVRDNFAKLDCPVLALHGREDWLVPMMTMQRAVGRKGGARIVAFPAAHMLLQTCAAENAMEILAFAKSPALREAPYED